MGCKSKILAIMLFLAAPAAFANEHVAVNIPFSFDSGGKHFPANQYDVQLADDRHHLILVSMQVPSQRLSLLALPAETGADAPQLHIEFDNTGGLHALHSIRLGSYESHLMTTRSK